MINIDNEFIEKARAYYNEIYTKEYGIYIYVPMAESVNLSIPVTVSCSYNKCLYCDLNHGLKFKILKLEEIEDKLKKLVFINKYNRRDIEKIVLIGGNPFVLSTNYLIEISKLIESYFPKIKYISSFARADDILNKTVDDLELLKKYKYNNLSIGIESGSDIVLNFHKKGVNSIDNLNAMKKLEEAYMDYSIYIMLGLGGVENSKIHALETAKLLNKVHSFELTVVNLVLFANAPLAEKVRTREFKRLSPIESLEEEYLLLKNLNMKNTIFNGTHKNNIIPIKGRLPEHKDMMLKKISKNIEILKDNDLGKYEHRRWNKWSTE